MNTTTTSALDAQVGGGHYKSLKIQPVEFSMANGWDACAHSVLKYVTRHRDKAGKLDAEKAQHFVELRADTVGMLPHRAKLVILVSAYCAANSLPPLETRILILLEQWVISGQVIILSELRTALAELVNTYPAEQPA